MAIHLLTTKLYIPSLRSELVPRPRLIEKLNVGLHCPLTLISAPAGFGKTTLVSSWISDLRRELTISDSFSDDTRKDQIVNRVAWLSLDQDDNDPVRFFSYLIAALKTMQADIGLDTQALLQSPQPPPLKTILTMLLNDLSTALATDSDADFLLILDDYHLIEQPSIHEALTFLLEHLPPQMHLVIASRADPPLPLARLRVRNQLAELRATDLRFTREESAAFFNQAMGLELSTEEVATLETRTEGWVAGLQLAALSMRGRVSERIADFMAAFSGSHRHVIDYLAAEVMAQQPRAIHDFLCQTSILDRFTVPLCQAVTGREDSQAILNQLEQANLFLIPLDDQRNWYRYHRLFADFLRSHLAQDMPDQIPELHRRASRWYAQHGFSAAAIEHALAAADFERAAQLIEGAADTTLMRSEVATLQGWLEALPNQMVRTRPRLCVYHAWTLILNGSPLEVAEARLQEAIEADPAGTASSEVLAFRAWMTALQGDTQRAIEMCQQALECLPEQSFFLRGLVAASLGLVYAWRGDVVAGNQAFTEAARVGRQTNNLIVTALSLCRLAQLAMLQGQLNEARTLFAQVLELAVDGQGRPRPVAGVALIGLGWLLYEGNDLAGAQRHLLEGIELTNQWAEVGSLQGYILLALLKQSQGDTASAQQAIQTAQQLAAKLDAIEMDDTMVAAYQARLWVAQGNIEAVLRWVEARELAPGEAGPRELEEEITQAPSPLIRALEYMVLARLYLRQGRPDEALTILRPLLRTAEQARWTWSLIEILILLALAYQGQGQTGQALTALKRALSLAGPEGYIRLFINEGTPMVKLLQQAAAQGIAVEYVGKLLAAFADLRLRTDDLRWDYVGEPTSVNREIETPQEQDGVRLLDPLSERELEVLRLVAAGLSNREVAEALVVALSTVKTHLNNIYRKLDVSSRTQAVARARALKLI